MDGWMGGWMDGNESSISEEEVTVTVMYLFWQYRNAVVGQDADGIAQ